MLLTEKPLKEMFSSVDELEALVFLIHFYDL